MPRSCRPSSRSRMDCASRWWPRASRRPSRSSSCAGSGAISTRASTSAGPSTPRASRRCCAPRQRLPSRMRSPSSIARRAGSHGCHRSPASSRAAMRLLIWTALLLEALIAGIGVWLLNRKVRQAQLQRQQETQQSQALLDRLSIATQAAGIYCWQLDWGTYSITWDESRLPAAETAAASRRHFGMELGGDLFKYVHPEDQRIGGKAILEALARGENHVSFRYRLVLPDDSIRHVQAFARTYTDAAGKPQRSLGVSWDVTAEVEAAQRAARDASMQRQLFERLSVAMQAAGLQSWEFDFKRECVTWLDTGGELTERTPEAVKAAGEALLEQVLPEDRQALLDLTAATARRGDPLLSTHFR